MGMPRLSGIPTRPWKKGVKAMTRPPGLGVGFGFRVSTLTLAGFRL